MTRRETSSSGLIAGAVVGGTALVGGILMALAAWPQERRPDASLPSDDWQTLPTYTEADVEAAARMLASENPRGSEHLHVEQIWTQLRARKPGESLYARITAGSGWGAQGEHRAPGGVRPVSTAAPATDAFRKLARAVLDGERPSALAGARKFFEPAVQDRAFAIAEQARKKEAAGLPLSAEEARLRKYKRTAAQVREKWQSEGARLVGTVDGVQFFT